MNDKPELVLIQHGNQVKAKLSHGEALMAELADTAADLAKVVACRGVHYA